MLRYQRGEEQAFNVLFARYASRIYRFLLHAVGDRAEAEDLTQHSWLHVIRARDTFRPDHRFRPWLYRIATNLYIDAARARARRGEVLTSDGTLPEGAGHDPQRPERHEAVRRALLQLPEGTREVIILHRWHDLSFAEIGEATGISESAAKVRAHRGYLELRGILMAGGAS